MLRGLPECFYCWITVENRLQSVHGEENYSQTIEFGTENWNPTRRCWSPDLLQPNSLTLIKRKPKTGPNLSYLYILSARIRAFTLGWAGPARPVETVLLTVCLWEIESGARRGNVLHAALQGNTILHILCLRLADTPSFSHRHKCVQAPKCDTVWFYINQYLALLWGFGQ